ncbi:MAG: helicase SNF2 [Chloroflexi bacterium]|nr:MAG: helicase SNF2 [Chloroflexota bacterium]
MILRYSSRRQRLDHSFLRVRLQGALAYDRIAGYFSSSLLEVAGEELEGVAGLVRMVCNADLDPQDIAVARAAAMSDLRRDWCATQPEAFLQGAGAPLARIRFRRLYHLLRSGKLAVRVLPDRIFGLIHGKAGVITLADGGQTSFIGSANESRPAWQLNYELIWEDSSSAAVAWVQEEFDALWSSPYAVPLAEAVIEDIGRLAARQVFYTVADWQQEQASEISSDPAPVLVEAPVYRKENGLWAHQKYFVKAVWDTHTGPTGKARFVLADQVGLGKTVQLAMAAQLIALTGDKPCLVICPKTLLWQWQAEMLDLLDMPAAVWNGRQWIDEHGIEYPVEGPQGIRKCPRRVGIVSSGLISRGSEVVRHLLALEYDCVILDEAHRARRHNLGEARDHETPEPNNLLQFMYEIAPRTRSLLLATATPVQLRPVEAWDLLDVLSRGDESVLGNAFSRWRRANEGLRLIMGHQSLPAAEYEQWEWLCNPLPPKVEHRDFEIFRRSLNLTDDLSVAPGSAFAQLKPADRDRLRRDFGYLLHNHNPFIRRMIRRTRQQLEQQIDPETNEPLLKPIRVELLGEGDEEAIRLPPFLKAAYETAEEFCQLLGERLQSAGFLRTLLLRRVGSSIYAGFSTAQRMLGEWEQLDSLESEEDEETSEEKEPGETAQGLTRTLTVQERSLLERFIAELDANQERDPKYEVVRRCLLERRWLEMGCIIFSQYRDSIRWLIQQLATELPTEPIALYSGPLTSGIQHGLQWTPLSREELKQMVRRGELRLLLGTDAASEGLNLQRLARLINLDLPWNPTRLEQRKGRIQRIGQKHDVVQIYNLRYKDSVEDRVHQLLSGRLQTIHSLFGQIPDTLEDVWVQVALGEVERAQKLIDAVPQRHPFELRYAHVEPIHWESCEKVLDASEKRKILSQGWTNLKKSNGEANRNTTA